MKFATLGPEGTCHQNAARNYVGHFGLDDADIVLVENFDVGIDRLYDREFDYLIQNSAHLNVHIVTERYHNEISVLDTFIYPTQEMALLEFADVEHPRTVGLVPACDGYMEGISYPETFYEVSKPVIARKMIEERAYDAGLIYMKQYLENPGMFRLRKYIGHVVTGWLVYGRGKTFNGEVLSTLPRDYYRMVNVE